MRHAALIALSLSASAVCGVATTAHAQDAEDPHVAEARAHFDRGRTLAEQRRFSEAAEAFSRSLALVDRPSTIFNLAITLSTLGRQVEAIAALERYEATADVATEGDAVVEAQRMLAHARASVGEIVVDVVPADAAVAIDGEPVPGGAQRNRVVNPGPHVLRVEAEGYAPQLLELDAESGVQLRRGVQLESTRADPVLSIDVGDHLDSAIRVDGREVGRGSARLELEPGDHRVEVVDEELAVFERTVHLAYNDRLLLSVAPVRSNDHGIFEDAAPWIGLGLGLAAVAAGILIGVLAFEAGQPGGGSTGVVLMAPAGSQGSLLP